MRSGERTYGRNTPCTGKVLLAGFGLGLLTAIVRSGTAEAQENPMTNSEKVYVQLDRDVYVAGGTIHYKAFVVDASTLRQVSKSRILYMELTGAGNGTPIRWRINLSGGNGSGSYVIPSDIREGLYSLKAYTNWLRNGKPEFLFSRSIVITKISDASPLSLPYSTLPETGESQVLFYPEGGQLVEGITSRVGFRLPLNTGGLTEPRSLKVMDDTAVVMEIQAPPAGTGSFEITPGIRKLYKTEIIYADSQRLTAWLPMAEQYGHVMHLVEVGEEGLKVRVTSAGRSNESLQMVNLKAYIRGAEVWDTAFYTGRSEPHDLTIPDEKLTEGVIRIVLTSTRQAVLCQRLAYFPGRKKLLSLAMDKDSYLSNESVRVDINIGGLPLNDTALLAVTVTESTPFEHILNNGDIATAFLLASEISGWPDSGPSENNDLQYRQDLLLCTDPGDYIWNDAILSRAVDCSEALEDKGYILKGRVLGRNDGRPVQQAGILISVTDSIAPRLIFARTDSLGRFYAVLTSDYDNKDIILQLVRDESPSSYIWEVDDKASPSGNLKNEAYLPGREEQDFLRHARNIRLIETIYETGVVTKPPAGSEMPANSFEKPDMVVYPAEFSDLANFREITENILPGVRFTVRNQDYTIGVYNRAAGFWLEDKLVLLNGVPFRDLAYIATLGSREIRKIEVFTANLLIGNITFNGLVSIYTYDNKIPETYLRSFTHTFMNEVILHESSGQVTEKQLTAPRDHENPDFRQTLYWNPAVRVSSDRPARIEFMTSQVNGRFEIDIQGITKSGLPISLVRTFEVK